MLDLFDISSFRKDPPPPHAEAEAEEAAKTNPKRNLILDLSNERKRGHCKDCLQDTTSFKTSLRLLHNNTVVENY